MAHMNRLIQVTFLLLALAGCDGDPTSFNGKDGARGAMGTQGDAGAQGPQGATGASGTQGPAGAQGAQGPAGMQGPVGPQGDVGPMGPAGATGATGAVGPQGAQGIQGAQGAQGIQGPAGPAGTPGPLQSKSDLYVVSATAALPPSSVNSGQGSVIANCTNIKDIAITGGCLPDPQARLANFGPANLVGSASGWGCGAVNSLNVSNINVTATVTCLIVP